MNSITIENKKTYNGNGIYIGRGSPLGNPFKMESEKDRQKVINEYKKWLWRQLVTEEWNSARIELDRIYNLWQKQDIVLICWCAPKACHGDVIKSALEWYHEEQKE